MPQAFDRTRRSRQLESLVPERIGRRARDTLVTEDSGRGVLGVLRARGAVRRCAACYRGEIVMNARTAGRQAALQMLFGVETSGADGSFAIRAFWREFDADPEGREYADAAVRGVLDDLTHIDELIRKASTNWRLERMARVDRNLMRLATWEILTQKDVPRAVIIDEAVELAKRFGGEDSSAFVNGVLDRIAEEAGRIDLDRDAAGKP